MAKGFSKIDGKVLRSFGSIVASPGERTAAHVRGQRRNFIGPLALFFIANALFVAVQAFTGTNILSTPLESHLHQQDWSSLAQAMVNDRLAASDRSLAALAPAFDRAAIFNAKALMILMVVAFVPILAIAFHARDRRFGVHVIFGLHLYAFVLLLLCAAVLVAHVELALGGDGMRSPAVDLSLSLFNLVACALYIYVAIGRVYRAAGRARVAKAVLLGAVVASLFVGYRFVIFVFTLYTV